MQLNACAALALALLPAIEAAKTKDAILLSKVRSITLRGNGQMTTHRRLPAVPQLQCRSSPALCRLAPLDVMRCSNQGAAYDDEDIQWSCTASLPPELKLGATDVVCEGYSSADDRYVLRGSCAVEYRLILTDQGEERYPELAEGEAGSGRSYFTWLILAALAVWLLYVFFWSPRGTAGGAGRHLPRPPGYWGGGWGGGGGPGDDPPPPYPGYAKPSSSTAEAWRPGFFSGLASGAAAGYYAGSRNNNNRNNNSNAGTASNNAWGGSSAAGPSRQTRHESTGFGSTRRR